MRNLTMLAGVVHGKELTAELRGFHNADLPRSAGKGPGHVREGCDIKRRVGPSPDELDLRKSALRSPRESAVNPQNSIDD